MEYGIISSPTSMEENNNLLKFPTFDETKSVRISMERDSRSELEEQAEPGSYVLRENPKKSKRFVDSKELRFCKECGKGFQSTKALCGHMACHSDKEIQKKKKLSKAMEGQSDTESSGPRTRRGSSRRVRYKSFGCFSGVEREQQEVAISLMLLSRDCSYKGGLITESSSNNSVVLEARSSSIDMIVNAKRKKISVSENSDSGYYENENGKGFSKYELRKRTRIGIYKTETETETEAVQKRSKYECSTCKKTFNSHTALGGHRASHAKTNGCCAEIGENSVETTPVNAAERKKSKGHECPICFRIFKSGQALGGHKRSHFVGGREANSTSVIGRDPTPEPEPEITVLFDLNLPAPMDEDVQFIQW